MYDNSADKDQTFIQRALDERSSEWGRQVQTTGESLQKIGEQLRQLGAAPAADLADRGADYADRLGSYLQDADPETLLHDIETFARREPLAVLAGGLVAGIAAARMLKLGSSRRYRQYGDRPSYMQG